MIIHVLMFKFKDEVSEEEREGFEKGFIDLEYQMKSILKQEVHHNFNRHQDYDLLCIVYFRNMDDYNSYDLDEGHRSFARRTKPLLEKLACVDYEVE